MRIDENDIPHIEAQCAKCGHVFDMKFGLGCPLCQGIGVKWARLLQGSPTITKFEQESIDACERLYALEDPRREDGTL